MVVELFVCETGLASLSGMIRVGFLFSESGDVCGIRC